jgi:hypothetical protein
MSTIEGSNRLPDLAARIKAEHEACVGAMRRGLKHAITAGELLAEARELVPHGEWLPWLANNCAVSARSAQRYMKLAGHKDEIVKNDTVSHMTINEALDAVAEAPDAERRAALDNLKRLAANVRASEQKVYRAIEQRAQGFEAFGWSQARIDDLAAQEKARHWNVLWGDDEPEPLPPPTPRLQKYIDAIEHLARFDPDTFAVDFHALSDREQKELLDALRTVTTPRVFGKVRDEIRAVGKALSSA